ncbi:MAG: hypothetical protein ACR2PI_19045 [Hyphomicrobiaceae bacterium]
MVAGVAATSIATAIGDVAIGTVIGIAITGATTKRLVACAAGSRIDRLKCLQA